MRNNAELGSAASGERARITTPRDEEMFAEVRSALNRAFGHGHQEWTDEWTTWCWLECTKFLERDPGVPVRLAAGVVARQARARFFMLRDRERRVTSADQGWDQDGHLAIGEATSNGLATDDVVFARADARAVLAVLAGAMSDPRGERVVHDLVLGETAVEDLGRDLAVSPAALRKQVQRTLDRARDAAGEIVPEGRTSGESHRRETAERETALRDVQRALEAAPPLTREIALLLRLGKCVNGRDRRTDWGEVMRALQEQGWECHSPKSLQDTWREFVLSLPKRARRYAGGRVVSSVTVTRARGRVG